MDFERLFKTRVSFSFDFIEIQSFASEFNVNWIPIQSQELAWHYFVTDVMEGLNEWGGSMGLKSMSAEYDQVGLIVSFYDRQEAAYFKLKWWNELSGRTNHYCLF